MYFKSYNKEFKNFNDAIIDCHGGINVIIGHNNANRIFLLKALNLVTSNDMKRFFSYGFNKNITIEELESQSLSVEINVILSQSENDELDIWKGSTI